MFGGILRNITATLAPDSEQSLIRAYSLAHGVGYDDARRALILLGAHAAGLHTIASPFANIGKTIGAAASGALGNQGASNGLSDALQRVSSALKQVNNSMQNALDNKP
jgi:hypothetical protein